MEEQDFDLDGKWVDRLTATKAVAKDFIASRVGDRLGLILFGREAYLQTPLTFDRATVETLLNEAAIGLAGKETAIGDAIGLAIRTFDDAGVEDGRRVLVLLTDGANTAGGRRAAQGSGARGRAWHGHLHDRHRRRRAHGAVLVRRAAHQPLGRSRRADADGDRRRKQAAATFARTTSNELAEIYTLLDELEPAASEESGFRPVQEYFHWPLGAALLLALVWLAAGVLGTRIPPLDASRGEAA